MTMVTTRSEAERPPQSPDPTDDGAARAATGPAGAPPDATPSPSDAPRADVRGARTWRPRPRLLWTLTALFLLAAVAVTASLGRATWQQQRAADSRAAALAAGRQIAVNFVTMNAATFDADTKRVLAESTGSFQKEYSSTLAQLKPVVTANKTVSTVERAEASLVSGDDDSAKVIVGVVAPTSNASTPKAEKKTYRLRLDLVKVGDAWKVSNLDFVS
ncbi:hypothetical protein ACFQU3_22985 [Terrabacter sp. GCM10028922]|uniref:hypothetical protein n=1 Tax=Terrabacter sp. GCM10028922 TaxID=3273428 RepID=UPI0036181FA2